MHNYKSYMHMQHEYFDMPICQDEVMSVISNMKSGTVCQLKFLNVLIFLPTCNVLVALFNKIIDSGNLSQDWYTALIVPIFKSGSRSLTDNYRRISLLTSIYKLLLRSLQKGQKHIVNKTMYCLSVNLTFEEIVDQLILCLFCHLY